MANYQIQAEQLREGTTILVRGKSGFAQLTRQIAGEALVKRNQQRSARGMEPIDKPHTTIQINHAEVLFVDPQQPTPEEYFIHERRYTSDAHPENGYAYNINDKSPNLPPIMIQDGSGQYVQDTSGRELASGLDVTLVLRVFKPKNRNKRGIGLEAVVVNEPVRYYASSNINTDELAKRGIVFAAPPVQVAADAYAGNAVEDASVPQGSEVTSDGFVLPGPQGEVPAVAAPAPAAVPAAVPAPAAPVAAPAPQTLSPQDQIAQLEAETARLRAQQAQGQPAQVQPAVVGSPWDNAAPAEAGIRYNG